MKLEGFSIYRAKREEHHDGFPHHPSSFAAAQAFITCMQRWSDVAAFCMWLPFAVNPCGCFLVAEKRVF
ncbi:hypothetical protein ACE6H2_016368 [Prunus campanulata]